MRLPLWEILVRSKSGPIIEEKQFDLSIFRKCQELQKKYDIKYIPEEPVDITGELADRIYQAGFEFFLDTGSYCVNTHRVIKLTEREVRDELAASPASIELGQGADRVRLLHRDVEGSQEPIVVAGIQTAPFSNEDMMFVISKGCAMDRCVDGIWGGILLKIGGTYDVIAGTPGEIYQYRKVAEILRKAVAAAGRPGMITINNAPTSRATIAMFSEEEGLRKSDGIMVTGMSECKLAYDDLDRSAFGLAMGMPIHGAHSSTIGGFSATPEGAAITAVAATLQLVCVQKTDCSRVGVTEAMIKSRVTRKELWAAGTALQGLSRNTKLILDGSIGDHPAAGPGTKQYFYESAAGHIVSTVMGAHSTEGTRKFVVGNTPDYGSPLESRWMGEVCKAATGMDRKTASAIVTYLLGKYEGKYKDAPEGQTFEKLYDRKKMVPLAFYQQLYEEVKDELSGLGLHFRNQEGKWK
jgi:methylamine---corrinoid protein Co-methyltransferase